MECVRMHIWRCWQLCVVVYFNWHVCTCVWIRMHSGGPQNVHMGHTGSMNGPQELRGRVVPWMDECVLMRKKVTRVAMEINKLMVQQTTWEEYCFKLAVINMSILSMQVCINLFNSSNCILATLPILQSCVLIACRSQQECCKKLLAPPTDCDLTFPRARAPSLGNDWKTMLRIPSK